MNENKICEKCGCVIELHDDFIFDGVVMCEDCFHDYTRSCECCGTTVWDDGGEYLENYREFICNDCLERRYIQCEDCSEYIHRDDAYWTSYGYAVCEHCYNDNYFYCEICGNTYHIDDGYYDEYDDMYYCNNCYNKAIKNYSYKPNPIFYGKENLLYYGVELEVDRGGYDNDNAQKLLDIANMNGEKIYIKHDGSLNDGFEIVSHPTTLQYHLNGMNWRELMNKAINMGYRSHDTNTCVYIFTSHEMV